MAKGVAFDIGTTTVAACAVDLAAGAVLGASSLPNPQARWGSDVISRIEASGDPGTFNELVRSVRDACNALLRELGVLDNAAEAAVSGNTVMEHLFLGVSPLSLSRPPYKPVFKEAKRLLARDAGLSTAASAPLFVFPAIGGFVGGDAVAVALSLGLIGTERTVLAIDIGTNSEIILSAKGRLYATSAAAGPAFEGGGIAFGMAAQKGAIQGATVIDDSVSLDVIGGGRPVGICGSGLVEAVSALIRSGVIEASGRIKDRGEVSTNLSMRLVREEGANSFVLHRDPRGAITLSQKDIRALQVAKGAIRAGVSVLMRRAKIDDVDEVYVAGAFGSRLTGEGLVGIGLIDREWAAKVKFVGDAALSGTALALRDEKKEEAEAIARSARYVPLSGSALFEKEFIRRMNF